jgi:hypothetical protein
LQTVEKTLFANRKSKEKNYPSNEPNTPLRSRGHFPGPARRSDVLTQTRDVSGPLRNYIIMCVYCVPYILHISSLIQAYETHDYNKYYRREVKPY